METNDLKLDTHELRMEALQNAMQMVNELEMKASVKGKIADLLEEENEQLMNTVSSLQDKIDTLEGEKHDMEFENELLKTNIDQYNDWNKVHYALYFFLFVYGMVYGVYLRTKQQEL